MRRMRILILLAVAAAPAWAQQPTPAPVAPPRDTTPPPARDTTVVALDKIVAVVGDQPITQYDLQERILAAQQTPGFKPPTNEAEFQKLAQEIVNQLIDEELLVQKGNYLKIEIPDTELSSTVDKQMREIRGRFSSDAEFRAELAKAGLGTPEEYRRFLIEQMKRNELQRRAIEKLRGEGRIPPVNVSEAQVEEAFNRSRTTLPRRPATVTFRQIIVSPKARESAKTMARARAESLLVEIRGGADFERVAKRESA